MRKAVLIVVWFYLSLYIIWQITHLQFINKGIFNLLVMLLMFLVPGFIAAALLQTIESKDSLLTIFGKMLGTLGVTGLAGLFSTFLLFGLILSNDGTDVKVLYSKRNDHSKNIVMRSSGGFGPDSYPEVEIMEENKYANFLVRYTAIDTATIDRKEWVRVKKQISYGSIA